MEEELSAFDMPETTKEEIIDKIEALAWEIRNDWSDPRGECRTIVALCKKLKEMQCAMAKGFIIYTHCCMGETLAVLMAYNGFNKKSF